MCVMAMELYIQSMAIVSDLQLHCKSVIQVDNYTFENTQIKHLTLSEACGNSRTPVSLHIERCPQCRSPNPCTSYSIGYHITQMDTVCPYTLDHGR
jgi:hypothetical protein